VLTELCLRLEPLPDRRAAVSVAVADAAAAEAAWRWLRREGPDPSGLELRAAGDGSARLRAWFLGDDEPVREATAAARRGWEPWGTVTGGDADAAGAEDADAAGPWLALRLLTAPSRVFAAQARAADLARARSLAPAIVAYPNDGEVHLRVAGEAAPLAELLGEIAAGARAGAWHYRIDGQAPGWAAPEVPAWSADAAALRLMARVKEAFDPRGVLRPGSYSAARLAAAAEFFAGGAEERVR